MKISPYAKAIVGGIVAGLSAASVALSDGTVTPVEGIAITLAVIAGTGITWAVPNKPSE